MKAEKAKGKKALNFKEDMNTIQTLCLLHIMKIALFEVKELLFFKLYDPCISGNKISS